MEHTHERRLGRRHVLGPVAVRWRLDARVMAPAERRRRKGPDPEKAGLLDLSVSGAKVMARTSDDLSVGDWTVISIGGATGPVVVRRITDAAQDGFSHYGLEFLDPLSPLTQLVHTQLANRAVAQDGGGAPPAAG